MKKYLTSLMTFWGVILLQTPVISQEYSGCFVIDSSGNYRNLPQLCPNSVNFEPNVLPLGGNSSELFQVRIKTREGGTPVVDVTFNGSQTFEMLFDTGATGTLITSEMGQALGIQPQGKATATIADGSQIEVDIGLINSVQVGNLMVGEIPVGIAPPGAEQGLRNRGLLGQDVYGTYDITIKQDVIEFRARS